MDAEAQLFKLEVELATMKRQVAQNGVTSKRIVSVMDDCPGKGTCESVRIEQAALFPSLWGQMLHD